MNIKSVKKHILEELAHGKPIQKILSPDPNKIRSTNEDGGLCFIDDPDWVKPDLPDWNIVVQWLKDDEAFRADYEHAMKYGAVYLSDELVVLKDKVVADPKNATAYKVAMEAIRTAAMWRDPKYSERTIQEIKNTAPQAPEVVQERIKQLMDELGFGKPALTVDVQAVEVKPANKRRSPAVLANLERARAARKAKKDAESS